MLENLKAVLALPLMFAGVGVVMAFLTGDAPVWFMAISGFCLGGFFTLIGAVAMWVDELERRPRRKR